MEINLRVTPCFGVAGNFTGHLEQAGEAKDFENVKTAEANAPKALFPTYIPIAPEQIVDENIVPLFLHNFPFDADKIIFPKGEQKVQIEPECAVICDLTWENKKVTAVKPRYFGASNDCSIRKDGAKKISIKKNWGQSSKGLSNHLIGIDKFSSGGILDNYRIASFLVRDGIAHPYGEDSAVRDYSYIYEKLINWITDKLNNQKDEGPAEEINRYLNACKCPQQIMISIGATRYTDYGEHNFLQDGDKSVVAVYPESKYTPEQIQTLVESESFFDQEISFLSQQIVL